MCCGGKVYLHIMILEVSIFGNMASTTVVLDIVCGKRHSVVMFIRLNRTIVDHPI